MVAAGETVSGLAVAGASSGGVGIGAGLFCVDIFVVGDSISAGGRKQGLVSLLFFFRVLFLLRIWGERMLWLRKSRREWRLVYKKRLRYGDIEVETKPQPLQLEFGFGAVVTPS